MADPVGILSRSFFLAGCAGTMTWDIGDTGKTILVMYSVPYSFDLHSNWLAVGIDDKGEVFLKGLVPLAFSFWVSIELESRNFH